MNSDEWTEGDIQALKAQEAKDLAVELLHRLQEKEQGPISPGEVQLQELEYDLRLKQAELEDKKAAQLHEQRTKELELEIQRERTKAAEATQQSDGVRQGLAELIQRVKQSEESLGVGLERAHREHRLRIEQLENDLSERRQQLEDELQRLTAQRDELAERIQTLIDVEVTAEDLAQLSESVSQSRSELEHQQRSLEDELATFEFEKTKRLTETQRTQELELAKLRADHEQAIVKLDRETAENILEKFELQSIAKADLESLHQQLAQQQQQAREQATVDEATIRESFRREYNITASEPIDVTDLFYQHQAAQQEADGLRSRIEKLEAEYARARQHIEQEPQRITAAVEAARPQVQKIVEPSGKP